MSFYSTPTVYSSLLGSEDIPATMLPSNQSRMIPCSSQLKAVRTQSANLGAGALGLWQIQTGSGTGFLKANSVYLRGSFRLNGSTTANALRSWRFTGCRQGITGEAVGEGDNKGVHSASSMISRLTVSNGAQQISQLTNYNVWHDLLMTHATSSDYNVNDATVYEYNGVTKTAAPSKNPIDPEDSIINFSIPLISPFFCGQQSIPLFLLNSPLSVEILFNSLSDTIINGVDLVPTGYTVSNAEIVYEEIIVSPELKASIMSKLQGGALWKQYLDSVYSIQSTADKGNSYNIGVGVNSCKAVLGVDRHIGAASVGGSLLTGDFALNGFSNIRVMYDGKLINNFDLTNDATVYAELNRSLHSMFDSNITSCLSKDPTAALGAIAVTDYVVTKFAWGLSSQAVNDMSIGFSGMPVQMITVQHSNETAANSFNFQYVNEGYTASRQRIYFVLYDELLTIDANGVCSLIR